LKTPFFVLCAGLAIGVASAALGQPANAPRTVILKTAAGADAGSGVASASPRGVLFRIEVRGLSLGPHGLHIHEVGDCSGPGFTNAGPHLNFAGVKARSHGLLADAGPHPGDLPNIYVGADGIGRMEAVADGLSLRDLTSGDGAALIVTARLDDYRSQPDGASGPGVLCGTFR